MPTDKVKQLEQKLKVLRSKTEKGVSKKKEVDVLNDLATEICVSNPKKAEDYARKGLALAKRLDYKKGIAVCYRIIGISWNHRGEGAKGLDYHLKSLKIHEEIGDKRGIAAAYGNIGAMHHRRGEYDEALKYYRRALKVFVENKNRKSVAISYLNIGSLCDEQGNDDKALENYLRALEISEEIGDKRCLLRSYSHIGNIWDERGNYDQALEYFLKALKIGEEIGDSRGNVIVYINAGKTCVELGKFDQALEYYNKALKTGKKIGFKEAIAAGLMNIGDLHERQADYAKAREYYLRSLKISEETDHKRFLISCYENMGSVQLKLRKYNSAFSYLQRALQMAHEAGQKKLEMKSCKLCSELFEIQQQFDQALHYHKQYSDLEREIYSTEKSKQITDMKTKYETEKKEKEAEIHRLKNIELKDEIRRRRKAEKELKKHRDQLEKIVAKRTAKLKATNITLKREIATRRMAEKELINYQKQLRSLAHELSLVEERQRRKIATNLHDSISQSLMLVKSSLEMLASRASSKNMKKQLKEVQSHVTQMIQRTRSMTFEISPPVLYELGLEPAMEWLAESFQEQHGISCEFNDDGVAKPVSADWRCILFQSTRELLANIRKHAKANRVLISTRRDGKLIRITVEDDGIGFDPNMLNQKIRKNEGFGLFNLRERLTYLKGSVEIDSEKGKGTTVTLLAPLKRGRRATTRMQA